VPASVASTSGTTTPATANAGSLSDETQVLRRHVRVEREAELAQAAALPPVAQQVADVTRVLHAIEDKPARTAARLPRS
jgi:hypothetical protein